MTRDLHHLAAAYALDALTPAERAAFEGHYPTCDICATEVGEFRETAAVLAGNVAVDPPTELKASVMAEVARTRQLSPIVRSGDAAGDGWARGPANRFRPAALAAVAAALLFVLGMAALLLPGGDEFADVVAASDAVFVTLEGADGQIEAIWSPARDQVALRAVDLDRPGAGGEYALWHLVDDGVVLAGSFEPDRNGQLKAVLDVADIDGQGWGVTIEPDGIRTQPTGEVIYVGEL